MKKKLLIVISIITILFTSCSKENSDVIKEVIEVNQISLSESETSIILGETLTITAKTLPENAENKTIHWSSEDSSIASINNGIVTAKKVGCTNIIAECENGISASCKITIKPIAVHVTGITLEKSSAELVEFNKIELQYTITPKEATNKEVVFTSSDEKVATVNNGLVTAVGAGNAKINLKTVDGDFTATFTIFVTGDNRLGSFIDSRDGHEYKTVKIGNQIWMAENLAYLPEVYSNNKLSAKTPLYYVYDYLGENVEEAKQHFNYSTYGVLYNWEAAKISAPEGWHIATDEEFKTLETYLGMESDLVEALGYRGTISEKLKSTYAWMSGTNGTNTSGFNGLPGGYLNIAGEFAMKGQCGDFWTSTAYTIDESRAGDGYERMLFWTHIGVLRTPAHPEMAYSVRCIKD